jgi:hypothetical protein
VQQEGQRLNHPVLPTAQHHQVSGKDMDTSHGIMQQHPQHRQHNLLQTQIIIPMENIQEQQRYNSSELCNLELMKDEKKILHTKIEKK